MNLSIRIQTLNVCVWSLGWWGRDVAEAEDPFGLRLGPGGGGTTVVEVWVYIWTVVGLVCSGHGVAGIGVVFGVHFRVFGWVVQGIRSR